MATREYARTQTAGVRTAAVDAGLRAHMNKVYALMAGAMVMTGLVAYVFGQDASIVLQQLKMTGSSAGAQTALIPASVIETLFFSPVRWVIMFAPLAFILIGFRGSALARMSASSAQMMFWAFGAVMGLSISWIFAIYTGQSIARVFFITAIAFGGLSLWGYTTKKDLSGWGSFLIMGVIGLIVAMVVNIFLASSAMQFAISAIGVLIFAGLTAYDTQSIKNEYLAMRAQPGGEAWLEKGAVMGALRLYLDFINMFMFLLQLLGNRQ